MEWKRVKSKVTDEEFNKLELFFKAAVPNDYKEIVSAYNGGRPGKKVIKVNDNEYVFYSLLSICENDKYNIYEIYSWIKDRIQSNLIPIAEDSFGNYYCYDKYDEMKIKLWNHETDRMTYISESLEDIINSLDD